MCGCGGYVLNAAGGHQLTLSASTLDFGNVTLNTTATKSITLSSTGSAPLSIISVKVTGAAFVISDASFPATLTPGQTITIRVSFSPTVAGTADGTIIVSSDASVGKTATVTLAGNGTPSPTPQLTVSANALDFGGVSLNAHSIKTLTLTSSGSAAVTVNSVTLAGGAFAISGVTFPTALDPGQSVTIQVAFSPSVTGAATGTIIISSNSSPGSSTTVALSGTGSTAETPQLTASSSTLNFGNLVVNGSSTKTLTLTSSGTAALTVNSVVVDGTGFSISGGNFPATVSPGQSVTLNVKFSPKVVGPATGNITISSNSTTSGVKSISLSGTGTATPTPQLKLSTDNLSFGTVTVNTTLTKRLTLTSSGTAPLTVTSATVAGSSFVLSGGTFPAMLNPGESLTLQVSFDPVAPGSVAGSIAISTNSSTGTSNSVALSGTGTAAATPNLALSATSLNFGNVTVDATANKTLTLVSSGTAVLMVNSVTAAGSGFAISGATFPTALNPGQSLTLQVSFRPTITGAAAGTITILSNDPGGGTETVSLSGTGSAAATPNLTLSTTSLDFGNVTVDSSLSKTLTLTSTGTAALTVNYVTATGSGFVVSGATFPTTLNPGQSLTLQVSFNPTITGAATGTTTISSTDSGGSIDTVDLSGTGTAVSTPNLTLSANSLSYGSVTLNTTTNKTLTLTSSGTAALTISSVAVIGNGFGVSGGTLPVTLNPGQSITLQVSFDPTAAGAASGSITVSSNSNGGAITTVTLSGTGTAGQILTLSTRSLSFGDVTLNTSTSLPLILTSTGSSPVTISAAAITGAEFTSSGAIFPVTLNPGVAITLQVKFAPTTLAAASGSLSLTSNSSTGTMMIVTLTGNGISAPTQHQVSLSWLAPVNSPAPVTGYNVYRAATGSSSFVLLNSSTTAAYADLQVSSGTAYTYYVTSFDAAGTESVPSNQVTVTIP